MLKLRFPRFLPSLSTLLIVVGVICMAVGTFTAFQYRPRPLSLAEQTALQEGEQLSSDSHAVVPVFLPAPGVAELEEKGEITALDVQTASAAEPATSVTTDTAPAPEPACDNHGQDRVDRHRTGDRQAVGVGQCA